MNTRFCRQVCQIFIFLHAAVLDFRHLAWDRTGGLRSSRHPDRIDGGRSRTRLGPEGAWDPGVCGHRLFRHLYPDFDLWRSYFHDSRGFLGLPYRRLFGWLRQQDFPGQWSLLGPLRWQLLLLLPLG